MSDASAPPVVHDAAQSRFQISIDGAISVIDYVLAGKVMTITHTFVPPTLRGRGIAEALMKAAIGFAQTEKLTIDPVCSYAARYLEKYPPLRDGRPVCRADGDVD
jgi:predicted GNAT family acetyltransferase